MALTKEHFKAKQRVMERRRVVVEELGEEPVFISKMNAKARDKFEQMVTNGQVGSVNLDNIRARFLTLVCTDEDGKLLFEESDAEWLGELDTDIIQKLAIVGFALNGINADAVEDAAKN